MSALNKYLREESANIEITLCLIEELLGKPTLDVHSVVALGTYIQNAYTGVERIIRGFLEAKNIRIEKGEFWHTALLQSALREHMVSERQYGVLLELLKYRHVHIHGYGHLIKELRLREIAAPAPATIREFLKNALEALDKEPK
ncbi:MAG: hypothetical protein NTX50_09190 [Candidatus Sumerlaeota bacterium]|nr:hypothetical protein [Candidatus Sumerlaeota bacterium]